MIEQGKVYAVDYNNFRRKHFNRAHGEVFLVEVEISQDDWYYLRDFPTDATGTIGLQWTDRAEVTAKEKRLPKTKEPVTANGRLWQYLIAHGFHRMDSVKHWLDYEDQEAFTPALYVRFKVTSRTEISAEWLLQAMCNFNQAESRILDNAISLVNNAIRDTQGQHNQA